MTAHATTAELMSGAEPTAVELRPLAPAVAIYDDLSAVEALWRELQSRSVSTPYQRFEVIRAYTDALAAAERFEVRILVVTDTVGAPQALLPLAVRRKHGLRVAEFIGGKHANYHMLILGEGCPERDVLRSLLVAAARGRLGVDALALTSQPVSWDDRPNPLAAGGRPSPSAGHRLRLDSDPEATLQRAFSKDARKKLRQKEKKLGEQGPVAHRVAACPEEAERFLDAFFAQKAVRFREQGIPNPFDEPGVKAFLRSAALDGLDGGHPALDLHALLVGDRVVAVFAGANDRERACGMLLSFDQDPEIARSSPGDLLLRAVIAWHCRAGRRVFDLGVGEARYKGVCDEVEEIVDVFIPVTLRGRAFALVTDAARRAKRWVKQTPWALRLAAAVRARAVKGTARPPQP